MGTLVRGVVILLIIAAFSLTVSWAFCKGLSDIFPGGMCGSVLSFVDRLVTGVQDLIASLW
jgi:hypothetical protein